MRSTILSPVSESLERTAWTALALVALVLVDALMRIKGFKTLHRLLGRLTADQTQHGNDRRVGSTRRAVDRAASLYFKRAWCLERSIVMVILLRARNIPAELVIGARKMPFDAHAWVELAGEVISDEQMVKRRYMELERCSPTEPGEGLDRRRLHPVRKREEGVRTPS